MATLTLSINSALGNTSRALTFSGADATRIMNAYQAAASGGTQQQLTDWLAQRLQREIATLVAASETTTPAAPVMT